MLRLSQLLVYRLGQGWMGMKQCQHVRLGLLHNTGDRPRCCQCVTKIMVRPCTVAVVNLGHGGTTCGHRLSSV